MDIKWSVFFFVTSLAFNIQYNILMLVIWPYYPYFNFIEKCQNVKFVVQNINIRIFKSLIFFKFRYKITIIWILNNKHDISQMHRYFCLLIFISLPSKIYIDYIYIDFFLLQRNFSYYIYTTVQKLNVLKSLKSFNVFEQIFFMFLR